MIREDTFYYLSLLAYYNVKKIGVSVTKLCQMIEKDKDVLQQAEEMDDAKGNLEMIKRMPFENYCNLYLVSSFDDNKNSGVVYDVYENEEAIFIAFRGSEILDERNHTTGWQDWLINMRNQLQKTTLLVTHDIDEAIYLSDRILILHGQPAKIQKEIQIKVENRTREWLYSQGQLRTSIHQLLKGNEHV